MMQHTESFLSGVCLCVCVCACRRLRQAACWPRWAAHEGSEDLCSSSLSLVHLRQWHRSAVPRPPRRQGPDRNPRLPPRPPPVQIPAGGNVTYNTELLCGRTWDQSCVCVCVCVCVYVCVYACFQEGNCGVVTGWGLTRFLGRSSRFLRKVTLPVVSYSDCIASTEQVNTHLLFNQLIHHIQLGYSQSGHQVSDFSVNKLIWLQLL